MALFTGTPARTSLLPLGTPQQQMTNQQVNMGGQQLLSYLLQNLMGGQEGQSGFAPIAQRARTQFNQQTIPSIAERFNALGGGRGSGLNQSLAQAASGLEEGLAAQESQYNLQQQGLLQGLLGQLLQAGGQPQFENIYEPSQPGLLQSLLPGLLGSGLSALGPLAGMGGNALYNKLFGSVGRQASSTSSVNLQPPQSIGFTPKGYSSPYGKTALDVSTFGQFNRM